MTPADATTVLTTGTAVPRRVAPVMTATGIEKSYRRGVWPLRQSHPVLRGAELALDPGEVVGLAGENGSGKSTLMKILVGALAADAGTVDRAGKLGYCPQDPQVFARLTCDEHLELFSHAYGMSPAAYRSARTFVYESLGFERYASTRADQLSGLYPVGYSLTCDESVARRTPQRKPEPRSVGHHGPR
jgi:ABC-2 type transport system ATP-binding protein